MNYKDICLKVIDIVKETAAIVEEEGKKRDKFDPEAKSKNNFVTYVDTKVERKLVKELSEIVPGSGFIAEEGSSNKIGDTFNWVIDPIDGTTNFIHGLPPFAISVALMENREIILGVVYELGFKECFYAWKESKAYMNGNEINVSSANRVSDSLIATGFPYTNYSYMEEFIESLKYFMENSHGLRRLGSAATDIAYVACGRFEAFYEYGLNSWDVAAASFILDRAGGQNSDFFGGNDFLFGGEIISSNQVVHNEIQQIIQKIMK